MFRLDVELKSAGYCKLQPLATSLQGSVFKALHEASGRVVAVKRADKLLHANKLAVNAATGRTHAVLEDIRKEAFIMRHICGKAAGRAHKTMVIILSCTDTDTSVFPLLNEMQKKKKQSVYVLCTESGI